MNPEINELWAWCIRDPADDTEGVPALEGADGMALPMMGADEQRMRSLRAAAIQIANDAGQAIQLRRFSVREDVETIEPGVFDPYFHARLEGGPLHGTMLPVPDPPPPIVVISDVGARYHLRDHSKLPPQPIGGLVMRGAKYVFEEDDAGPAEE